MNSKKLFLTLHGIPTRLKPATGYKWDDDRGWRPVHGDNWDKVEDACLSVHRALEIRIFGSQVNYAIAQNSTHPRNIKFYSHAGLNSELPVSQEMFEKALVELKDQPYLYRFLYLYDCAKLVTGIQEITKETVYGTAEFYRILNLEELSYPPSVDPDGIRWLSSPSVTNLLATLSFTYIRLYSLLDYIAKLAYEVDNLALNFESYPKLRSRNILFDRKHFRNWEKIDGTIFAPSIVVNEIETVRNVLIHGGFLDDFPKAYKEIRGGKVVEKFVLMPDMKNGRLEKYHNRNLFYGREDRINLRLPKLIQDIHAIAANTITEISKRLMSN